MMEFKETLVTNILGNVQRMKWNEMKRFPGMKTKNTIQSAGRSRFSSVGLYHETSPKRNTTTVIFILNIYHVKVLLVWVANSNVTTIQVQLVGNGFRKIHFSLQTREIKVFIKPNSETPKG